ncbi:hypothetical protein HYALB_00009271 [Hymenoscyphus albidus]|uniref:WD40 repeat-like protein n=1 Tax=Hymenoscyphus albidus TaxID=595503 RepID=A0A9N9LL54_9HELO|nr:hypothetical protein HYALB_00009271 [Hymenoscyphus albidus]
MRAKSMASGYQETAVRLQKEWNTPDPQKLPCAPYVPNHALVVLLNRGLVYSAIAGDHAQVSAPEGDAQTGFFGPLPNSTTSAPADEEDSENVRKRQMDNEQPQATNGAGPGANNNGPPAKRPRLSNGYDSGNGNGNGNGFDPTPMEIDDEQNGLSHGLSHGHGHGHDENAYPSPSEQAPLPLVITVGPERGIQPVKVSELSTETLFLELSDDQAQRNAVLLQCEWNPRDPAILAAAGTDALARLWTLSRTAAETTTDATAGASSQRKPLFQPFQNLLSDNAPPTTTVTGLSWSSDGKFVAVASEPLEEGVARIGFWTAQGHPHCAFDGIYSPIILLRWNPSNTACLVLSPGNHTQGVVITIMDPAEGKCFKHYIPDHSLLDQTLDAAWTKDDKFVIGGGDILQEFRCAEGAISMTKKFETRDRHAISMLKYDWRSTLLATASETGMIDIWNQTGQCHSFNAHQGVITALMWQPLPVPAAVGDDAERLLASAGEDCAISIWNGRSSETKPRFSMTMHSGVTSLAFTPCGIFIAGATTDQIFIWKVDDPILPRAAWNRSDQSGWSTPMSQDSNSDENNYSLSWDSTGRKLAYGFSTSLAIINFGR